MNWTRIKDRLPELNVGVLITDGKVIVAAERTDFGGGRLWWTGHGFGGDEWEFDFMDDDITHWTALPEGPEEKDGD